MGKAVPNCKIYLEGRKRKRREPWAWSDWQAGPWGHQGSKPVYQAHLLCHLSLRYRVVVSYPPQSEAEIELKEGDIVFVHKKREDGWYKGTLQRNGRTGLFPGSFVESF